MSTQKWWLSLVGMIIAATFAFNSAANPVEKASGPDFAFPTKVEKSSSRALKQALASGNDIAALRELMNIELALTAITADSVTSAIKRIDAASAQLSTPQGRSLASLLKASIYSAVYDSKRYIYDRREIPLTPLPDTCTLWSGEQFRTEISRLCREALIPASELQNSRLDKYASLIWIDKESKPLFPTLFDFAADKSIRLISQFIGYDAVMPLAKIDNWRLFIAGHVAGHSTPYVNDILGIYRQLIDFHRNDEAPRIFFDLRRLSFVYHHVRSDDAPKNDSYLNVLAANYLESQKTTEMSGLILQQIFYRQPSAEDNSQFNKQMVEWIDYNLKHYPAYAYREELSRMRDVILCPETNYTVPKYCAPGLPVNVTFTLRNARSVDFAVFDVSSQYNQTESKAFDLSDFRYPNKAIERFTLTVDSVAPFSAKVNHMLTLNKPGVYVIIPTDLLKSSEKRCYLPVITATNLAISRLMCNSNIFAWVTDPLSGRPIPGAALYNTRKRQTKLFGHTDSNGMYEFKPGFRGWVTAAMGNDKYSGGMAVVYEDRSSDSRDIFHVTITTDRPVYHPGDTVRWAAVASIKSSRSIVLGKHLRFNARFNNANWQLIDSLSSEFDDFGRAQGAFAVPDNGLTGQFSIAVSPDDPSCRDLYRSKTYVEVSDYKMPEFFVEFDPVRVNTPANGAATVSGHVATYSGFGMADATVNLTLSAMSGRWFMSSPQTVSNFRLTTDQTGRFTIDIDSLTLAAAMIPHPVFRLTAEATSQAGETQSAETSFALSRTYRIDISSPGNVNLKTPRSGVNINVTEYPSTQVARPVVVTLSTAGDSTVVWSQRCMTPVANLRLPDVESGEYHLTASPGDDYDCSRESVDITLYRPDDKLSPSRQPLWVPADRQSFSGNEISTLYATTADTTYILAAISTADSLVSMKQFAVKRGMHTFKAGVPASDKPVFLSLVTFRDFKLYDEEIAFQPADARTRLLIEAETFRDRLTPGSTETWRFRIMANDSSAVEAAVIAQLYNSALDKFGPINRLQLPMLSEGSGFSIASGLRYNSYRDFSHTLKKVNYPEHESFKDPEWVLYGRSLYSLYGSDMMVRSYQSMKAANTSADSDSGIIEEALCIEDAESETAGGAEPGDGPGSDATRQVVYRDSEVPVAFFKPMLTTDSRGRLEIEFTAPDANALWQLRLFAYDNDLLSGSIDRLVTAAKPLMVAPNLPRFVRHGDIVAVPTLVMNNTDSAVTASSVVEIFDPASGKVLLTRKFETPLEPQASATVTVEVVATAGPLLGYRVRSEANGFADGEQAAVPVLAASQSVSESQTFYINPDSAHFEMTLPDFPDNASVTLNLCCNPMWNVVTALPALSTGKPSTPAQAAAAIFTVEVARKLMASNPEIKKAFDTWRSAPASQSALTSLLEKNEDLKQLLLNETPWVEAAASQTDRMTRLAMLFEPKTLDKSFNEAVALLENLSDNDGGFRWMSQCTQSSEWATAEALSIFARLNLIGIKVSDTRLKALIAKASSFVDKSVGKAFGRSPKASYLNYAFMRTALGNDVTGASSVANRIISAEINKVLKSWRKFSISDKAAAVIVLAGNGHPNMASQILASISDFAVTTPREGMFWPSLEDSPTGYYTALPVTALLLQCYREVGNHKADINNISRWIILQKEARDWGSGPAATAVVASVMASSPQWITGGSAEVAVGATQLKPDDIEAFTGAFNSDITALSAAGRALTVDNRSMTPAWGAVTATYTAPFDSVKASAGGDLAIEKRIYRLTTGADGSSTWQNATSFEVGDRVKVELIIRADRAMDYITITDNRAACLEPVEQLPEPLWADGLCFYRENRDARTNIFVTSMPKGLYRVSYECYVNNAGRFASGLATIQSQQAPQLNAHSAGSTITVRQ